MVDFNQKKMLGKSGLKCGRIGIASSFGAPTEAYEMAFERGCNYFTWGTFIKGRSSHLEEALKNLFKQGKRDQIILSMISYAHSSIITNHYFKKGLKKLGTGYADVLILGYYSKPPPTRVIEGAVKLKEQGLIRAIGITTHQRKVIPQLAQQGILDLYHVRYNAVNSGADKDVFPRLPKTDPPGMVAFTATCWKRLLNPKKMPPGEKPPTPQECYRFVLSNPHIDVCMVGAKNTQQMKENLEVLDQGPMSQEELQRMRKIGDHIYGKKRE
jgi:predicted aldo/keto reductase-like oxidoreductase